MPIVYYNFLTERVLFLNEISVFLSILLISYRDFGILVDLVVYLTEYLGKIDQSLQTGTAKRSILSVPVCKNRLILPPVCPQLWNSERLVLSAPAVSLKNLLFEQWIKKWSYTVNVNACSVGQGDSSHFPHIYNSTKTGGAGTVCSSVMVVSYMTFMHSEYP